MKKKILGIVLLLLIIVFFTPTTSSATVDPVDQTNNYKTIVDVKCYTNGIHTGWKNTCTPGFSLCSPTNCDVAN